MSLPISGFTAIPNPQMLAFMPIQSYLMMYFAGAGWQIGKRKISAIPNDQFNKMSANDLLEGFTADLRGSIPTLERSLNDITPLISTLMKQFGDFIKEAINVVPEVAQSVFGGLVNPKGALVPPLFGPELEKLVTGNASQAQFLAYAKILLQQEADRLKIQRDEVSKSKLFNPPFQLSKQPVFQGPEINSRTGETNPFVIEIKSLPPPKSHIKSRPRSNVSLQSLKLHRRSLENVIRDMSQRIQDDPTGQITSVYRKRLKNAKQQLSDFLKMHGARF